MSLFLLVSIGSVCAEDVGVDADIQSADVESVDILANESDNPGDDAPMEKINTTIVADGPEKIKVDADKNIAVSVKDNESNDIDITKDNLTVTENNKKINFDYNNSVITIRDTLTVGEHNLTISYLGNANYTNSSTSLTLKIFTDNTLEVPTTVDTNTTTVEIDIKLTDGIDDNTNLLNQSNTQVILNQTILDWVIDYENKKLIINNVDVIPSTLTINYTEGNRSVVKNVAVKYRTQVILNATVINITEGETVYIALEVIGADGNKIYNITASNLTVKGVKGSTTRFNKTSEIFTIANLTKGVYNATITFKGNDVNNTSYATVLIYVRGEISINTNGTSVNVNSTKKGEIQIINITNGVDNFNFTQENINITVTYKDGNETKNITITEWNMVNGTISFTLENGNFTTANLTIDYNNGQSIKNITLNRIYNVEIQIVNTVNEYQNGNFSFRLVDVDDGNAPLKGKTLSLLIKGNISVGHSATTNDEGIASFKTSNLYIFDQSFTMKYLEVGNHTVELSTSGALKSDKVTTNLTVNKATIKITIDPYKEYYGSSKKVKITVTNANNGDPVPNIVLHLYMPQTAAKDYYFMTNVNGTSEIGVGGLVGGDYELTVSNNDTANINNASTKTTIKIVQIPVKVKITSNLEIYYNSGKTATIKVTDKSGKAMAGVYILVQIDKDANKTYLFQTNKKGIISFSASLGVGKHTVTVATADTRYKGSSISKTITVKKASATIKAPKVTDYYKGAKYFTVKLVNSKNKKEIYDAKLNIKIFVTKTTYYNYNGRTAADGKIRLSLSSLKPGTYNIVVSGKDSKNFTAKQVTSKIVLKKAPTKLIPKKLTAKKGAKKYFKVTVKNKKTKKVIKGVKVKIKVYTGKKAKTYTAKTNSKGIAKISTSKLKVGSHKVIVTSGDKYCIAKKAKSTIKITKK